MIKQILSNVPKQVVYNQEDAIDEVYLKIKRTFQVFTKTKIHLPSPDAERR